MGELYFLRHGQSELDGKFVGSTDCNLSQMGRADMRMLAETLGRFSFDEVYCSPLQRCRETCRLLGLAVEPRFEDRIREIDFGSWEGLNLDEIMQIDAEQAGRWLVEPMSFTFPEGEAAADFAGRVTEFIDYLPKAGEQILIITHGGVISFALCKLLGISFSNYGKFNPMPGHYATVRVFGDAAVLTGFNLR